MADLSLITILPSQQVQGVSQSQVAPGTNPQGTLLASVPPGTILQGFIVNRDSGGNPVLRTAQGDITFSTNFFLKIGSEVVIRVGNNAGTPIAHILSVDGQPPEVAASLSAFAQEPEVIVGNNPPPASPGLNAATPVNAPAVQVTQSAPTISGIIISTPQPPASTTSTAAAPAPALPAGSQLTLKVISLNVPTPSAPPPSGTVEDPLPQAPTAYYATYAKAAASNNPVVATPSTTAAPPPVAAGIVQAPAPQAASPLPQAAQPSVAVSTAPAASSITVIAAAPSPAVQPAANQLNATSASVLAPAAPVEIPAASTVSAPAVTTEIPPQAAASTQLTATVATVPAQGPAPQSTVAVTLAPATPAPAVVPAAISPEVAHAQAPVAPQPGQIVTATAIGHEPTGETLVQTPLGVVRLQSGGAIPSGSTATFEIVQATPPSSLAAGVTAASPFAAATQPAPLTQLAQQWSSLQQIFSLLSGRTTYTGLDTPPQLPIPVAQAGVTATPHNEQPAVTSAQISSGLMVFLSALRGSDFTNWLGAGNMRFLDDQGHGALVKKAEGEFLQMARQFGEATPHQWQPIFFPVAVAGALQQVRMYTKRDRRQGGPQGKKQDETRFVVEVDLTQLGEMQMDGFVRKQDKDVQFDMVIRSLNPLSKEIQDDILAIYNAAGQMTGFKGSLAFQFVKEFPVNPMQDLVKAMGTVVA